MIDPQEDALARAIERLIVCYDRIRCAETNADMAKAFEPESEPKYRAHLDEARADRDRAMADLAAELAAWRRQ